MKLHPLLSDSDAVLISHMPVDDPVRVDDYRRAAWQALAAFQLDLDAYRIMPPLRVLSGIVGESDDLFS